jgi:hypothetical protein
MGGQLGPDAIRISVKDASTNNRMIVILEAVLGRWSHSRARANTVE